MYNYNYRKDTSTLLNFDQTPEQIQYKPIRRQASLLQNQHINSDIFGLKQCKAESVEKSTVKFHHNKQSTDEFQYRAGHRVNYPHQKTSLLIQPFGRQDSQKRMNDTFKSQILGNQPNELADSGYKDLQYRIPDHSKEFILHCVNDKEESNSKKPKNDVKNLFKQQKKKKKKFEPKYPSVVRDLFKAKDYLVYQNTTLSDVVQNDPENQRTSQQDSQAFRQLNPKQSELISNILGLPERDQLNKDHLLSKKQSQSDLKASAGKSNTHPWLQRSQACGSQKVNESANFDASRFAAQKKLEQLRTSSDNIQAIPIKDNKQEANIDQEYKDKDYKKLKSESNNYRRVKTDLIDAKHQWILQDSSIYDQNYVNLEKSHYPQTYNTKIKKIQDEEKQNDDPLEISINLNPGSMHNKMYNVTTPLNDKNQNSVSVIKLDIDTSPTMDIKNLRNLCRQNGFHLVNFEDKYNRVSNKSSGKGVLTIRGQGSPEKSLNIIKDEFKKQGFNVQDHKDGNGLKHMKSRVITQQEQQRKQLEDLEKFYKKQAAQFLNPTRGGNKIKKQDQTSKSIQNIKRTNNFVY